MQLVPTETPRSIQWQPRFHVRPQCDGCKGADPDFPFYDERHQMYHLMYQFFPKHHPNPVIGHVASRDLVTWAPLPVALSNSTWYDRLAIWTGSATIVDGVPWLTYPGHFSQGVAEAARESDRQQHL